MTALYYKLPDGSWGVKVDDTTSKAGDTVSVLKRSGGVKDETLSDALYSVDQWRVFKLKKKGSATPTEIGNVHNFLAVVGASKKLRMLLPTINGSSQLICFNIAGGGSKRPGCMNVTDGGPFNNNKYFGYVTPAGEWNPSRDATDDIEPQLRTMLIDLTNDWAVAMKKYKV